MQSKKSPKDKSVKFYPVIKTVGRVSEHEVAKQLAEETTLKPKEAEFVLA